MGGYFLRRLLLLPPTLLGITILVFMITRLVPGGPLERAIMESQAASMSSGMSSSVGQGMALSEEQLEQLKQYYGFDKPWLVSYGQWVGKILQGDLGASYRYNEPVWDIIKSRFPVSLFYGIVTLVITYAVSIPLGVLKAIKHRTAIDNVTSIFIFAGCCSSRCASSGSRWGASPASTSASWTPGAG
jgi:microcin C transport system permease protein